jgi:hypothetical protein
MTRAAWALAFTTLFIGCMAAGARAEDGSCPERSEVYQKRFEQTNAEGDMTCMQQALQRELSSTTEADCPETAEHYETAYTNGGRTNDMVCALKAKQRENQ